MTLRFTILAGAAAVWLGGAQPAAAQLVLQIDQATGAATIFNPSDTDAVGVNGYSLVSPQDPGAAGDGLLDPAGWADLETAIPGGGWTPTASPSNERLGELNEDLALTLDPGASQPLGSAFTADLARLAAAQALAGTGGEYRDVVFQYTDAGNNSNLVTGAIEYSNAILNTLTLEVDRGTGAATLINESLIDVEIEAFFLTSAAGSLDTSWNGLRDDVASWATGVNDGNALQEFSLRVSETDGSPLNPVTIAPDGSFDLGTAFSVGGDEDVAFNFLLTSDVEGNGVAGLVRYVGGGTVGDYNSDDAVNAADYTVWRDSIGAASLPNQATPGVVGAADYDAWAGQFGQGGGQAVAAAAAVPEPTGIAVAAAFLIGLASGAGRKRS